MTTPSPYAELVPPVSALEAEAETEEAPAAGTPLADLATDAADDQQNLERLDAHVELADGTSWDVPILNRDWVAWDMTRAKKKWPTADEAPFLLNNYLAWSASRRAGHPVGTVESFVDAADLVKLTRSAATRPTR